MALQEEFEKQGNYLFRYRGTLPLIFLVLGAGAFLDVYYRTLDISRYLTWDTYVLFCVFVCLVGQVVRIVTVGFVPKNTSGRNTKEQVADVINTSGIYSVVRHPLYVGNFFMWLGIAMLSMNTWFILAFIFIYWVYYERIMFAEEQFLRKKFGQPYLDWAEKTPAFVPRWSSYRKPNMPFSWKKILKQEKNGFFAIFLLSYFFATVRNLIEHKGWITEGWLFYATIGSGLLYLILKSLKRSSLLQESGR